MLGIIVLVLLGIVIYCAPIWVSALGVLVLLCTVRI